MYEQWAWMKKNRLTPPFVDPPILQQDGAPAHTSKRILELLKKILGEGVISLKTDQPWPASSPDLNPCDYWLWTELKRYVHRQGVRTLGDLKKAINDFFEDLNRPENWWKLEKAINSLPNRARAVIALNGENIDCKTKRRAALRDKESELPAASLILPAATPIIPVPAPINPEPAVPDENAPIEYCFGRCVCNE